MGTRRALAADVRLAANMDEKEIREALAEKRRQERDALRAIGYLELEEWVQPVVRRRGFSDGED